MLESTPPAARLLLLALALLLAPLPAPAVQGTHQLRWIPPGDIDVAGYRAYLRYGPGPYGDPIDLGFVAPDDQGVASATIVLGLAEQDAWVVMTAYDAASNESELSNEILVPALPGGGAPAGDLLLAEDFESYPDGGNPAGWLDTAAYNSLTGDDTLFRTRLLADGGMAFGTRSTETNIHSHYVGAGSPAWSSFELGGRMLMTDPRGGIGVTFLSAYPASDDYYRLRRYGSGSFHIAPHPDGARSCTGATDTGVVPGAGAWYAFRILVDAGAAGTRIQARVWPATGIEPSAWQVDCTDQAADRLDHGTIGLWSHSSGEKYWDDLEVRLPSTGTAACDPLPCDDGNPCTLDGCDTSGCTYEPAADMSPCSDGNTCNGDEVCLASVCQAGSPPPDGTLCDDGDPGTATTCQAGLCQQVLLCVSAAECDDGNPCTVDTCGAFGCTHEAVAAGSPCGDGDTCNGDEVCLGADCVSSSPPPDGTACDDGQPGTVDDTCHAGACQGVLPVCASDTECEDGDPCTVDRCAVTDCAHEAGNDGIACDDGDPGTVSDECSAGICQGTPAECLADPDCDDGDRWNGQEQCVSYACVPGVPRVPERPILLD